MLIEANLIDVFTYLLIEVALFHMLKESIIDVPNRATHIADSYVYSYRLVDSCVILNLCLHGVTLN